MRIALVISTLQTGGGERVAVRLAKGFAQAGYAVTLVTLSGPESDFYAVPDGVRRIALDLMRPAANAFAGARTNVQRLARLRAALRAAQPDVIISFMPETNVRTLLALAGTGIPVIITEHSVPGYDRVSTIWQRLRRLLYSRAARLVGVSRGTADAFDWLPPEKRAVIYNPLDLDDLAAGTPPPGFPVPDTQTVVALGRLEYPKGFDLLIEAFARTRPVAPEWRLLILGEGTTRPVLEESVRRLGLQGCVALPGRVEQPGAFLRGAGFLAMSSRYEGFSLAIAEAFACGLPVVAFDCPTGPRELVAPGVNGLLVPPADVDALATAMTQMMTDAELRRALARNAVAAAQRFALEAVIGEWEHLFAALGLAVRAGVLS